MIGCSFSWADRPFWLGCNCRKIMMEFFNEVQNNLFSWKGTFKYWWHPGLIQLIFKKKLSFFRPQPYFWPQLFEGWIALTTLTEGFYGVEVTGNMALEIGDNLLRKHQQSIAKGGNNCDSDNPFWSSESLICSLLHFGCFSSKMTNSDLFCYFKHFFNFLWKVF